MISMGRVVLALLLFSSCTPASSQPVAPTAAAACSGSSFDADAPPPACVVPHAPRLADPPRDALALRIVEQPTSLVSGAKASFTLEMKNVTAAPLTLELDSSCLAWTTEAGDGKNFTFDSECGGLCGTDPTMLRVTLEPGGVIRKVVRLDANMRRVAGDQCVETKLGPLPPGSYTMKITLPWTDPSPIPGNAEARASRVFETPLTVRKP